MRGHTFTRARASPSRPDTWFRTRCTNEMSCIGPLHIGPDIWYALPKNWSSCSWVVITPSAGLILLGFPLAFWNRKRRQAGSQQQQQPEAIIKAVNASQEHSRSVSPVEKRQKQNKNATHPHLACQRLQVERVTCATLVEHGQLRWHLLDPTATFENTNDDTNWTIT